MKKDTKRVNSEILRQISYGDCCEIDDNDVDVSSFQTKGSLNNKLWDKGKLSPLVRLRLLEIADDFIEYLNVRWVKPKDVIMTGSLANYNWSKRYSDIDLHIKIAYKDVDRNKTLVSEYFNSKKKNWNNTHEKLKICGFPVELYVEDDVENNAEGGVYSLYKNKWIRKPSLKDVSTKYINFEFVQHKASIICTLIDDLSAFYTKNSGDKYISKNVNKLANNLLSIIYKLREYGFNKYNNEMNNYNIIFKAIRRMGYLDKVNELINDSYDDANSIDENK